MTSLLPLTSLLLISIICFQILGEILLLFIIIIIIIIISSYLNTVVFQLLSDFQGAVDIYKI